LTDWPFGVAGQWNDVKDNNDLYFVVEYDESAGIFNSKDSKTGILIYPNPSSDILNIQLSGDQSVSEIRIYDQLGVNVFQNEFTGDFSGTIDISKLIPGIYNITIITKKREVLSSVFIVK
jgi:hypothetical protein